MPVRQLAIILVLSGWAAEAWAGGAIGIGPEYPPGQAPQNVIGLRYSARINAITGTGLKLIFGSKRFYTPGSPDTYLLETNLYSYWLRYSDSACLGWPPMSPTNEYFNGQPGLWVSVPDYPLKRMVGVRQSDSATSAMFPRQNSGIDAISGLTKIETISQRNMLGLDMAIEYTRGGTFTAPLSGWGHRFAAPDGGTPGCLSDLPAGLYRIWIARVTFNGQTYQWEFALPDSSARYFAPWELNSFVTEFFEQPGFFQAYVWDPELQRENAGSWEPIRTWKMFYRSDSSNPGYGAKLATYAGHTVIELSNSGGSGYYQLNDVFTLPVVDAGTPDAGTLDAGTPDAGTLDAGTPDAGTPDAGTRDAGSTDAGTGVVDAGPSDAGSGEPDGGRPGEDAGEPSADGGDGPAPAGGCGCNSLPWPLALISLIVLVVRARPRARVAHEKRITVAPAALVFTSTTPSRRSTQTPPVAG